MKREKKSWRMSPCVQDVPLLHQIFIPRQKFDWIGLIVACTSVVQNEGGLPQPVLYWSALLNNPKPRKTDYN